MAWFGRTPAAPVIARLAPEHAEACSAIHQACFAHAWSSLEFERLITASSSYGEAAMVGSDRGLAGFILSRGAAGEAEVLTIAVAPNWRRHGVGRSLLAHHLTRLAQARIAALFLEVEVGNTPARRLYAATGFVEVGQRKAYYVKEAGEPPASALILRRTILDR